jgi:hypothetical protein
MTKARRESWTPILLFALASLILATYVLVPDLLGHGKTKDYILWYTTGQRVLHHAEIYQDGTCGGFSFIYTPFTAVLLSPLALFGRTGMDILLVLLNIVSWLAAILLSERLSGPGTPGLWPRILPSLFCLAFIFDMFDLGQPNLLLLTLMLTGLWLMRAARPGLAGTVFALAAAIKAFPIAIFPYLLWRRQWRVAGVMAVMIAVFLFIIPIPWLGWSGNLHELHLWSSSMADFSSGSGFGQRTAQNWSWRNQSLFSVIHRLTRPLNADFMGHEAHQPYTVNFITLSYGQANAVVLAAATLLGAAFLALMPRRRERTAESDAAEWAILLTLIVIASPLAREYYFVWLLFPATVLARATAREPNRRPYWIIAGTTLAFFILGEHTPLPPLPAALGTDLWGTFVLLGGLVWQMRRSSQKKSAQKCL